MPMLDTLTMTPVKTPPPVKKKKAYESSILMIERVARDRIPPGVVFPNGKNNSSFRPLIDYVRALRPGEVIKVSCPHGKAITKFSAAARGALSGAKIKYSSVINGSDLYIRKAAIERS